jgi:hypothetical protein
VRVFGWQTRARNESETVGTLHGGHHRPIMIFGERFESEHTCWDPKDGELCLRRTKSWETKMEVRRDSDVQIDLQI